MPEPPASGPSAAGRENVSPAAGSVLLGRSAAPEGRAAAREPTLGSEELYLPARTDASLLAKLRRTGQRLLKASWFDTAIGFVILANALCIGIDQSYNLMNVELKAFVILEKVFLGIYTLELLLRFFVQGRHCLKDNWVKFDCLLVFVSYMSFVVMASLKLQEFEVRTVRMLRLARTVRLLVKFRVLWMLVRSLLNSAGTMVYTMLLLLILIYVFASVGIELITTHPLVTGDNEDPEFAALVNDYFRSIPMTMLTLLQFVCLDSAASIYKPLIEKDLEHGHGLVLLYFVGVILVMPIVLMNIVTAVVVNGALEQASQDKDAQRVQEEQMYKKLLKRLKDIFRNLDRDDSGEVSVDEIRRIKGSDRVELQRLMQITDTEEIFHALDVDRDGRLSIDEFCEGIWHAAISKVPPEMQRMEKQVSRMDMELRRAGACYTSLQRALEQMAQDVGQIRETLRSTDLDGPPSTAVGERTAARTTAEDMPGWAKEILLELQCMRESRARNVPSPELHAQQKSAGTAAGACGSRDRGPLAKAPRTAAIGMPDVAGESCHPWFPEPADPEPTWAESALPTFLAEARPHAERCSGITAGSLDSAAISRV